MEGNPSSCDSEKREGYDTGKRKTTLASCFVMLALDVMGYCYRPNMLVNRRLMVASFNFNCDPPRVNEPKMHGPKQRMLILIRPNANSREGRKLMLKITRWIWY